MFFFKIKFLELLLITPLSCVFYVLKTGSYMHFHDGKQRKHGGIFSCCNGCSRWCVSSDTDEDRIPWQQNALPKAGL